MCVGGLMTNDHTSAESQSERVHSTAELGDQTKQASNRHVRKIMRTLLKGWRALLFLLIVLITGSYAFHYKTLSDPGSESKQLADYAPQEIDFFVSNPSTSIDVSAVLLPQLDELSVTCYSPPSVKSVTILMLTNVFAKFAYGPFTGTGYGTYPFSRLEIAPPSARIFSDWQRIINGYFAVAIHLSMPTSDGEEIDFDDFTIRSDLEQTQAYLYGHLPAIGTIDQFTSGFPHFSPILAERYGNALNPIRDIVLDPHYSSTNLSSFTKTPHGGPGEVFSAPAKISITETQVSLAPAIANQQINYMTPTGQISGQNYVWRGSGYLQPVFQATNVDTLQNESNLAFLSGILFGIAGAAAIAFVQEIPETFSQPMWWSRRKRKRKSSSQNA